VVFCCYARLCVVLVVGVRRGEGKRRTVLGRACSKRADWRCHSSLDVKYGIVMCDVCVCLWLIDELKVAVAVASRGVSKSVAAGMPRLECLTKRHALSAVQASNCLDSLFCSTRLSFLFLTIDSTQSVDSKRQS
jgi:hypothetical protein